MVKNTKGGSGHKRQARKNTITTATSHKTRFPEDPAEIFAVCSKIFGGANIGVFCQDGKERLCIMRKNFRGRGKRDNTVTVGSILLVGKREYEHRAADKKERCDLLEVYNENDKKTLEQQIKTVNWNAFKVYTVSQSGGEIEEHEGIEFTDEKTIEYENLMNKVIKEEGSNEEDNEEDEIDFDDI